MCGILIHSSLPVTLAGLPSPASGGFDRRSQIAPINGVLHMATVGEHIVDTFIPHKIDRVFCVPGES